MMIGRSEDGEAVLRLTRKSKFHPQITQKTSCRIFSAGTTICPGISQFIYSKEI
jgi:hypothetical protein